MVSNGFHQRWATGLVTVAFATRLAAAESGAPTLAELQRVLEALRPKE